MQVALSLEQSEAVEVQCLLLLLLELLLLLLLLTIKFLLDPLVLSRCEQVLMIAMTEELG